METLKQRGVTLQMPTMPTMANFQGGQGGGYQRAEQGEASTLRCFLSLMMIGSWKKERRLMIDWSMPGGLSSAAAPAPAAPAQFPSSGGFRLGGEDDSPQGGGGGGPPQTGRGGYQTID